MIDDRLKWNHHTLYVANTLCKLNGILYLCRNKIPFESLKAIYYALAYSHVSYCISIWGNTWKRFMNQVIIAQKRIIRTISFATRYERSGPLFIQSRMLSVKYIHIYFCALIIYKYINHGYCSDIFQRNVVLRELKYNTNSMYIPLFRTTRGQQSIMYSAPLIWNTLPNNLRSILNVNSFKRSLKIYLHNSQTQNFEENL